MQKGSKKPVRASSVKNELYFVSLDYANEKYGFIACYIT